LDTRKDLLNQPEVSVLAVRFALVDWTIWGLLSCDVMPDWTGPDEEMKLSLYDVDVVRLYKPLG